MFLNCFFFFFTTKFSCFLCAFFLLLCWSLGFCIFFFNNSLSFMKLFICFPWWKILFYLLFGRHNLRWYFLNRALIPRSCSCKIWPLRLTRRIKFPFLPSQKLSLVIKASNLLLLSTNKTYSTIRTIDYSEQLLRYALLHGCYKLPTLNILSYSGFTIKPSGNIDFHSVSYLLYLLYTMIVYVCLHLMNWIAWMNCCDSSLLFCVFED